MRNAKEEAKRLLAEIDGMDEYDVMNRLVYEIGLIDEPDEYLTVILNLAVEYCDDDTPSERRKKIYNVVVELLEVLAS